METDHSDIKSLKKVAKGAGFIFMGMMISKIISFLYRFFVARGLGPEGYGMIEIGIAVISFVWVFSSLGLTGAPGRYTAFYKGKNDPGRIKGSIQACIIMILPLSIMAAIFLFVISPLIAPIVTSNPAISPEMTFILQIMSFAIPFVMLNAVFRVSLRGLQNIKHMAYSEYIIFNTVQLGLVLLFLFMGWDVFGVVLAYIISTVITTISFFYFLQKKTFPIISRIKAIREYREILFFSLPLFIGGIAMVFLTWTDTLFIGVLQDASWSGIYNAALPLAGLIFIVGRSFGEIFQPLTTEMYAKGENERISKLYKNVTNWKFYAAFPVLLLLMLFSKNALHFVFGPEYVSGALALLILAFGFFSDSILSTSTSILYTMKKTRHIPFNNVTGAIINVVLNFLLIPVYGIAGAAFATVVSINITQGLATIEVWKITKMQPFTTRIFRSMVAGIISIAFIYFIVELFWEFVPFYMLFVLLFIFIGLYAVLLLSLGTLQKSDIEVMKAIENRLGIKNKWVRKVIQKFVQ